MDNIYKSKLQKILDKYKNMNIYINVNVKSLIDKPTETFKSINDVKFISDKSIIITNRSDNIEALADIIKTTKQCVLIMLLSKKDNLNDLIKSLNTTCVDIFSWHKDDKHDNKYFVVFQNE